MVLYFNLDTNACLGERSAMPMSGVQWQLSNPTIMPDPQTLPRTPI